MQTARKAIQKDAEEWVTLNTAARLLGCTPTKVLALIVKGDLVGKHMAGRTLIRSDSLGQKVELDGAA